MITAEQAGRTAIVRPELTDDINRVSEVLQGCEGAVTTCLTAMLGEGDPHLVNAVARDMDCTDVLIATRRILARAVGSDSRLVIAQLEACATACDRSRELCGQHAGHHEHCRVCADATNAAAEACRALIAGVPDRAA
jgi:hypothetical protein